MKTPDTIYLYRITHINNLDFIFKSQKISCQNSPDNDSNFIGIGDSTLIQSRKSRQIPIVPNGDFSDYVAFYFGVRSPMLHNIQKGYSNVTKRHPEDIVYLITTYETVKNNNSDFIFTDGHGYHHLSQFFNQEACDNKEFTVGSMFTTKTGQLIPKFIINFPTKEHWKRRSKIDFVKSGMKELVKTIKTNEIKSIAIPPLGCGNGGLNWNEVKPIIVNELQSINNNIEVIIYEPGFNNQTVSVKKEIALTPARAMLLCALKDYQILGYSINLLVAQKIAYFLQRIGEPLNLQYEKGHYGPYSNQLQHLLKYLNGYYLNFKHEETKPSSTISINHFDKVSNYAQKELDSNQLDRLKKTRELIEGFESPYGLELLATVDYVSQNENIINTEEMVAKIGEWTERKKEIMKPFHIDVAHKRLKEYYRQQWL